MPDEKVLYPGSTAIQATEKYVLHNIDWMVAAAAGA